VPRPPARPPPAHRPPRGRIALTGDREQADELRECARAQTAARRAARSARSSPSWAGERGDVDRITAATRAALGAEAFAEEHERGRAAPEADLLVP